MKQTGFTLLEACVAVGILVILIGSALMVFGEMTYFLGNADTRAAFALDSSSGFTKLDSELREIGQTVVGGVSYPSINNAGDELSFVRLASPPCAYDGSTDLEWDPTVYTIKRDNGELAIWQGNQKKLILCRNVQSLTFALAGRKLTIDLVQQGTDSRGQQITQNVRRVIVIRN